MSGGAGLVKGGGREGPFYVSSKAADGSVRRTRVEEVPGFAVRFPAGAFAVVAGVEAQALVGGEGFDGQDVPDVEGDDVGGEEVDVVGGVDDFALAIDAVDGLDVEAAGAHDFGAFQLHAPEAGAGVEDEVVAFAVSPRLGEVEAEGFGFEEEGGFGKFSGTLGVAVDGRMRACRGQGLHLLWAFRVEKKRRSYGLRLYLFL